MSIILTSIHEEIIFLSYSALYLIVLNFSDFGSLFLIRCQIHYTLIRQELTCIVKWLNKDRSVLDEIEPALSGKLIQHIKLYGQQYAKKPTTTRAMKEEIQCCFNFF